MLQIICNDLTGEPCSNEEYEHAEKVWATLVLKTCKSFCELYCKSDVIQLHCVFQAYRKTVLKGNSSCRSQPSRTRGKI